MDITKAPFMNRFDNLNLGNTARSSNYIIHIPIFKNIIQYAQSVTMPGVSYSLVDCYGNTGALILNTPTTATYDAIGINLILDENLIIYKELLNFMKQYVNPTSGEYTDISFNLGIEVLNNVGHSVFKILFEGCRLESIGSVEFTSIQEDNILQIALSVRFDSYRVTESFSESDFAIN